MLARIFWSLLVCCATADLACALEHVTFRRQQGEEFLPEQHVSGKLLVQAEDGGLLLMAEDGVLWAITPAELVKRSSDSTPFLPLTAAQVANQLLKELPQGFEVHTTAHYVIVYNTSQAYAQWCGALYERLYRAFTNFWTRKGLKLSEPELPLVALVFADSASYRNYAQAELGEAAGAIVGYYSLRSNRVTMYDLTGAEALRQPGDRRGSTAEINRMLSRPAAEPMVATIIHEATHQIAFNCGLQTRYSDIPVWLSEGLAVYFETPDLSSGQGWRSIGAVNRSRLSTFRQNLSGGSSGIASLLANDQRMRDVKTAPAAYAEAWALNYYLIRHKADAYVAYLKMLAEKQPLIWDDEATRLAEFRRYFGSNLEELEADFHRYMRTVR